MSMVYLAYSLGFSVLFFFAVYSVHNYRRAEKLLEEIVETENEEEI
ncbi:MAG: hypothetical protein ACTJLK_00200 [Anaplasma sp.]